MSTLPILLNAPNVLVLGGGAVAFQKSTVLYQNKIKFSLIALSYCSKFDQLDVVKTIKKIELIDFDKYNIVIDATGCDEVGKLLRKVRQQRYLLVNRVDQPDQCNFYFSSLLCYGSLKIAVSTNGASPTIGQIVRDKIAAVLPKGLLDLVAEKKRQRQLGQIDPKLARDQALILFSHVYLIECDDIGEYLQTLHKYPQLARFSAVLYPHDGAAPVVHSDPVENEIETVAIATPNDCFDCDKAYAALQSYCLRGMTVAVLIRSGEYFPQQSETLSDYLNNDGVKVEIIVKRNVDDC